MISNIYDSVKFSLRDGGVGGLYKGAVSIIVRVAALYGATPATTNYGRAPVQAKKLYIAGTGAGYTSPSNYETIQCLSQIVALVNGRPKV